MFLIVLGCVPGSYTTTIPGERGKLADVSEKNWAYNNENLIGFVPHSERQYFGNNLEFRGIVLQNSK
jgi:hypothetical protein